MDLSFSKPPPGDETLDNDTSKSIMRPYANSVASIEYLGKEPLTQGQAHLYPLMSIYPNQKYTFGLENCSYNIPDLYRRVSKRHFRIYTVLYEENNDKFPPLVYCEDLQSFNGTYINGVLIGKIYRDKIAYLLSDGDVIEVKPFWKFRFHQQHNSTTREQHNSADLKYFEDHFTISDRVLGQGQFGTVYLAKEVAYSTQVACKVIELKKVEEESEDADGSKGQGRARMTSVKQQLRKEIEILATLSHPNIISLRKAFCTDEIMYIFTDLAPGGDLFSYIAANGNKLDDLTARMIAWQLLQAVDYLHDLGIVHRDIKTENVLIAQTDLGGRVILTDFGFANYEDRTTGRLKSKVGTPGFVAPEVEIRNDWAPRGYTKAVDMWSCGILVAYMLTGEQLVVILESSASEQQAAIDDFCSRMNRRQHIKPNSVDFVRKLVVLKPVDRLSAPYALEHKWFTESVLEAVEQRKVYERATKYWRRREPEDLVIENISPEFTATSATEVTKRRKRLPDVTTSPYFSLDRHTQPKTTSTRRQLLADLRAEGSDFVVDDSPTSFKRDSQTQDGFFGAIKVVDGRNIFDTSTHRIPESLVETQDLTPNEVDEVDLVPTAPTRDRVQYTVSRKEFFGYKRLPTTSSPGPLTPNIEPPKISDAKAELVHRRIPKTCGKEPAKSTTAKALKVVKEKVGGPTRSSQRLKSRFKDF